MSIGLFIYSQMTVFSLQFQAPAKGRPAKGKGKKKAETVKFIVDCTHPVEDGLMQASDFVSASYLHIIFVLHITHGNCYNEFLNIFRMLHQCI